MSFITTIQSAAIESLEELYGRRFSENDFQVNETKPEFKGDYTIVLFSLLKPLKESPDTLGKKLGDILLKKYPSFFSDYNIIKGFLNLSLSDDSLLSLLEENYNDVCFGKKPLNHKKVMVEYSSPNTNKPLHLGHLRNIFIGWSVSEILKANGNEVYKSSIVNDRGIHICKSMIAWQEFANGATPDSTHTKGDHFVGDYYVKFNDEYKKEVKELINEGKLKQKQKKKRPL